MTAPRPPLSGIRVVELSQNLAGPYCGKILGEMGADVIKIEPPTGDAARGWGPPFHEGVGTIFAYANTGKRGLRLDLRSADGKAVLEALLVDADVLVESLRPGALDALDLGWDRARSRNPRLIWASVRAYGEEGPLRDLPGYEPLMQAHGGILSYTGESGGEPVRVGTSLVDMGTGMWTALGILGALRERDRTGEGSRVSGALFDTALAWSGYHLLGAASAGTVARPLGTELPMIVPYGTFPAADGPVMIAAGNEGLFRRLCRALELDELLDDPRFATNRTRVGHREEVNARVRARTAAFTAEELLDRLREAGVPAAPVRDVGELLHDPQFAASGMLAPDAEGRLRGPIPLRWEGSRLPASGQLPDPRADAPDLLAGLELDPELRERVVALQDGPSATGGTDGESGP